MDNFCHLITILLTKYQHFLWAFLAKNIPSQSARINLQSPQSDSTLWTLTLTVNLYYLTWMACFSTCWFAFWRKGSILKNNYKNNYRNNSKIIFQMNTEFFKNLSRWSRDFTRILNEISVKKAEEFKKENLHRNSARSWS